MGGCNQKLSTYSSLIFTDIVVIISDLVGDLVGLVD